MKYCLLLIAKLLLTYSCLAYDVLHKNEVRKINILKDGTYTEEKYIESHVLTEEGRSRLSIIKFPYFSSSEKVIDATIEILNGSKSRFLTKSDFSLVNAESSTGLSDEVILKGLLPGVRVGSIVKVKVTRHQFKNPLGNKYIQSFYYGHSGPEEGSKLLVKSELPLNVYVNDLDSNFKFEKKDKFSFSLIQIKKIVPPKKIEESTAFNPYKENFVSFSTAKNWGDLYSNIIEQNLMVQQSFSVQDFLSAEEIDNLKESFKNDKERTVADLMALVNSKLNYAGDYRNINDHFSLEDVHEQIKRKSGDCKLFSHLTLKVLSKLGFDGELVMGELSKSPTLMSGEFPAPKDFNHMFLRVVINKLTIYIDPTNSKIFYPDFINDSLRFRYVIAFNHDAKLEWVGQAMNRPVEIVDSINYKLKGDEIIEESTLILKGNAKYVFDKALERSKDKTDYLADFVGSINKVNLTQSFESTELTSKIKTFSMNKFTVKKPARISLIDTILKGENRVSDLLIKNRERHTFEIKTPKSLKIYGVWETCHFDNKYFEFKTEAILEDDILTFRQNYYPKALVIPADEVRILSSQLDRVKACFLWKEGLVITQSLDSRNDFRRKSD